MWTVILVLEGGEIDVTLYHVTVQGQDAQEAAHVATRMAAAELREEGALHVVDVVVLSGAHGNVLEDSELVLAELNSG